MSDFVIENGILKKYTGADSKVIIPDGVKEIGNGAFLGNKKAVIIVMPEGVEKISGSAFYSAGNLEEVVIPKSVRSIGNDAFAFCENLKNVTLPEGLTVIEKGTFTWCSALSKINIPEGVTEIKDGAFQGCYKLAKINIPESVEQIGYSAFSNCTALKSLELPGGIKRIGRNAFSHCEKLKTVIFGNGIDNIPERAFYCCYQLEEVNLAESVTMIGESAFEACKKLLKFGPVNPACKFGKDFLGRQLPEGLVGEIRNLYPILTDGAVKNYILYDKIWKKLDSNLQREIFMARQGKTLTPAYVAVIDKPEKFGEGILEILNAKSSAKECNTAANFMTTFQNKVSEELLNKFHNALKPIKAATKALKTIEADAFLMEKLGAEIKIDTNLSKAEQIVMAKLTEEKQSAKDLEQTLTKYYAIKMKEIPSVKYNDGNDVPPVVTAWLLTVHEKLKESYYGQPDVVADYEKPGLCPEAAEILAELDSESWQKALKTLADNYLGMSGRNKKMFLAYPICRYADDKLMEELTKKAPSWRSSVSGNDAPPLATFRKANVYSDTRYAMMFADKYHELGSYAAVRGTDADTIRDQFLSNIGIDENGGKKYDLGNQVVTARLQKDLSFLIELENGKTAKSIPKKGADEDKYKAANADFSEMKKSAKKIVKNRADVLFEDFLKGHTRKAGDWRSAYIDNVLLGAVARLLVWEQNKKTFTIGENGLVNAKGEEYVFNNKYRVGLAHPMEMKAEDLEAWQKYFISNNLKQPFEQIWEPVIDEKTIKEDRYKGCMVPYYRFIGQQKRGIYVEDLDFHAEINIWVEYCDVNIERIDWSRHSIEPNDRFEIKQFRYKEFDRRINHIVAYFDKITAYDRVKNDDVSVANVLPQFTLAQISQFINIASENNAVNVMAILLDYKNQHFADYDIMDEFSLEL